MNIVRWLANHPILSVWALTIVALLLSLGGAGGKKESTELASNEDAKAVATNHQATGQTATEQSKAVVSHGATSQQANTQGLAVATESTNTAVSPQVEVVATEGSTAVTNMANSAGHQVPAFVPAVIPTMNNAISSNSSSSNNAVENVVNAEVVAPAAPVTETNVASNASTVTEEQNVSTSDLGDKSVDDLLLMAREAYWNNGLDEAASIYQQLIEREPNVLEHKGELGNVYWRQGFPEKSADLYAEIAVPMIDKGNAERVANMIGFIGLFYPDKAIEITQHMQNISKK